MAKIKLTAGQLYFLRERDFLTCDVSRYVKIGLVRDEKETQERIREHQTGNPREIYDYRSLNSPFVEHLETQMHYRFAKKWITGEWFDMTEEEIDTAIEEASKLIGEQHEIKEILEKSYELGTIESNGEILAPTEHANTVWQQLTQVKLEQDRINAKKDLVSNQIRQLLGNAGAIQGIASVSIKGGSERFDESKFAETHPILYEQYLTKESKTLSGSFTLKGKLQLKKEDPELYETKSNLNKISLQVQDIDTSLILPRSTELERLHEEYIQLQKELYINDWEYTKLEAQLKTMTDLSDGIDGLCGWKREQKEKMLFDKKLFAEENPELYMEFAVPGTDSYAVNIFSWRGY